MDCSPEAECGQNIHSTLYSMNISTVFENAWIFAPVYIKADILQVKSCQRSYFSLKFESTEHNKACFETSQQITVVL